MQFLTRLTDPRHCTWYAGSKLYRVIAVATFVCLCAANVEHRVFPREFQGPISESPRRPGAGQCQPSGNSDLAVAPPLCAPSTPGTAGAPAIKGGTLRSADTEWVNWCVVNVCPARVYLETWRSDEKRMKLYRDFDPDVVDWWSGVVLNRGDFFTMRGVAVSSPTAYEYQEAIGPMWGYALKLFRASGAALRENGGWATFPKTKYGGAHMMCLNAPKWRNTVEQGMVRAAALGDSVTQDNIGCPVTKYHPGFCTWCNRRFVEATTRFICCVI